MSHDTDDVLDFINSLPDTKEQAPRAGRVHESPDSSDDFLEFLDELSAHDKGKGGLKSKFEPRKTDKTEDPGQAADHKPSPGAVHAPRAANENGLAADTGETTVGAMVGTHMADERRTQDPLNEFQQKNPLEKAPEQPLEQPLEQSQEEPLEERPSDSGRLDAQQNPLESISSWWSSEGSSKVTSLWGSLTSNAHQLSESTYQLASTTSNQLSHQRQKFLKENAGVADTEQILHITDKLNSMLSTMSQQIKDGLADKEDEVLNIFLVYDLNINYLDSLCAAKFNKVMGQVEGGIRTSVSNFNHKHEQASDGHFHLSMFHGKALDGEKLCFANLESSIKDYVNITVLDNKLLVAGDLSEQINTSNVFIAIQPITTGIEKPPGGPVASDLDASTPVLIDAANQDSFSFTFILKDITNNITIISKSQPFPARWAAWIAGYSDDVNAVFSAGDEGEAVDPGEWVREWIHDGLGLTFAVLAQEYVTKRMGIF